MSRLRETLMRFRQKLLSTVSPRRRLVDEWRTVNSTIFFPENFLLQYDRSLILNPQGGMPPKKSTTAKKKTNPAKRGQATPGKPVAKKSTKTTAKKSTAKKPAAKKAVKKTTKPMAMPKMKDHTTVMTHSAPLASKTSHMSAATSSSHKGSAVCRSCHTLPLGSTELTSLLLVLVFSLVSVLFVSLYALNQNQATIADLEQQVAAQQL